MSPRLGHSSRFLHAALRKLARSSILQALRRFRSAWGREARAIASSGLFDDEWYLKQNPDVAAAGMSPIEHFVRYGAREGRNPSQAFETRWYLRRNADVAVAGMNPFVHYVLHGRAEGRSPRPKKRGLEGVRSSAPPVALAPLAHTPGAVYRITEERGSPAVGGACRPVICVTHVQPWPRRAGNEYRIGRILDWLLTRGHPVVVVHAPLPGEEPCRGGFLGVAARYGNAVLCRRDGRVEATFTSVEASLASLHGLAVGKSTSIARKPVGRLGELECFFCHDALMGVAVELERQLAPAILYVNYVLMTRFLPRTTGRSRSFIDTTDVLSTMSEKVTRFGMPGGLSITPEEETRRLRQGDLIVAIQAREAALLRRMVPGRPVVTAGVDFEVGQKPVHRSPAPMVLCIASDNALNVKGLGDFLRFAWPRIRREIPRARLVVAGKAGDAVEIDDPRVEVAGVVEDVSALYRDAWVAINPAVGGTGLKVKTVEALAHGCPIVTWPNGVEGVGVELLRHCHAAEDWFEFGCKVIAVLKEPHARRVDDEERARTRRALSAETTYRELAVWLEGT